MAEDLDRMADLFSAALSQRAVIDQRGERPSLSAGRIAAYAGRADGPADLAIERALRAEPGAFAVYCRALGAVAHGFSPVAVAAGAGDVASRMVGPARLDVVEDGDALFLVIRPGENQPMPRQLEVRGADGTGGRIGLGAAVRGILQVKLDRGNPDLVLIADLIGRPDSAVYLLP